MKEFCTAVFGYKQHTVVDSNDLMIAVETSPVNRHGSQTLVDLVDKAGIEPGTRLHADKAYGSKQHQEALKTRGILDKAVKNKPLSPRQLAISKVRFVVERTFSGQQRWFGGKTLRYQGLAKAHAMPGTSYWTSLTARDGNQALC